MPPNDFRWMTSEEWESSNDLWLMIHNADEKTHDQRKLALFGVGCCRRHWSVLPSESQTLLVEFEVLLDQLVRPSKHELLQDGESLNRRANDAVANLQPCDPATDKLRMHATKAVCYTVLGSPWGAVGHFKDLDPREEVEFLPLLRDIFGNPFHTVAFAPEWRTDTALALASRMYEAREFSAMPILADALQDAGCDNADILDHCRDTERVHVRGCWVVDACLGKR